MRRNSRKERRTKRRRRTSIGARAFRTVFVVSLLLLLVVFFIGTGVYIDSLVEQYEAKTVKITKEITKKLQKHVDLEKICGQVMDKYNSLSDEERVKQRTPEYRKMFSKVYDHDEYNKMIKILNPFYAYDIEALDVYFAVYDKKRHAFVYIADPATEKGEKRSPGDWDILDKVERGLTSPWKEKGHLFVYSNDDNENMCMTGYPAYDDKDKVIGFTFADVSLDNSNAGAGAFIRYFFFAIIILVTLFGLIIMLRLRRIVVRPIKQITKAAADYSNAVPVLEGRDTGEKGEGDITDEGSKAVLNKRYFSQLNIHTRDEVEELSEVMKNMEEDIFGYVESLTDITAEKERINTELNVAGRIQETMLPHEFPVYPDRDEFDVYASMRAAKEVGGDFYDIFMTDDDHLVMVVADVSGKGIPAALYTMASRITINAYATMLADVNDLSPARILMRVNDKLCENKDVKMFVTVWLGILEISTGKLTAANGGHEYPILRREDGQYEKFKDRHGFVLGGKAGIKYEDYELQLKPGDVIFEYTDGVKEATSTEDELFGIGRITDALASAPQNSSREIVEHLGRAVDEFAADAPQFDDITMMCLRYNGTRDNEAKYTGKGQKSGIEDGSASRIELISRKDNTECSVELEARKDNLPKLMEFLDEFLEGKDCAPKTRIQLEMSIEEIFVNVAMYAYDTENGMVRIDLCHSAADNKLTITFTDHGSPYDPLAKEDPDTTLRPKERKAGGLGIYLTKNAMDDMKYEYTDGSNVLTLVKKM